MTPQGNQKVEPVAAAESVKQVVEPAAAPKVDFATDLFDMLSMDEPSANGSEAVTADDNAWAGFQCMLRLIPFSSVFLFLFGHAILVFFFWLFFGLLGWGLCFLV